MLNMRIKLLRGTALPAVVLLAAAPAVSQTVQIGGQDVLVDNGGGSYLVNVTLQKVRARNCDGYHGKIFKTMKLNFPAALPPYAASVQKNRLFCIDK